METCSPGLRGRARIGRFAAWVGAGEPRPNAYARIEEEGARSLPGRRPASATYERRPRAPLVRPELKGGASTDRVI